MYQILTYLLVKNSFWDDLLEEFEEIGKAIKDFFLMIKEITFDVIAGKIGSDIAGVFVVALCVIAIIMVCLAIINR